MPLKCQGNTMFLQPTGSFVMVVVSAWLVCVLCIAEDQCSGSMYCLQ